MPLREDILAPIAGESPSGSNLRYAPVYDKIKEARRQDDDAPQGDWQRERKLADFPQVIKLAADAIATKSKDLQVAAWLTEALLSRDGAEGLKEGLLLIRGLIVEFWDTLYPELEDGEPEFRAAPVEWVGTRLDELVRKTPITKAGYSFFKFKESRTVPSEADASENETRLQARTTALAEGKLPPEEFDRAVAATSREYFEKLVASFDACLETLDELQPICEEKFGEFVPSFSKLRAALEEVRHASNGFLQKKREAEGLTAVADSAEPEAEAEPQPESVSAHPESPATAAPASPKQIARKVTSAEPVDKEDAISRIVVVARFLRTADPYAPAPYLLLRALRWGELRANGSLDQSLLEPPSTQTRQHLKKLSMEAEWTQLLEAAEAAMGEPCGRGWLDIQRHVSKACEELGDEYTPIRTAVRSELKALLGDFPGLLAATLMDDTPAGNNDTQTWIQGFLAESAPLPVTVSVIQKDELGHEEIDSYDLAVAAAKKGRKQEAIEIMSGEVGRQNSGRGRFQRKLQLAQLCVQMGHESISKSILEELARTIDRHLLEEWESSELIAHALGLLLQCIDKLNGDPLEKQSLYSRICRLDPMQALVHSL